MTHPFRILIVAASLGAGPAQAADLFAAVGGWIGSGSLATTVERPMQPARCEVDVEPKAPGTDVSVTGKCLVSIGGSDISFRILRAGEGRVRGAMWSAATDEVLQLTGSEKDGAVDMRATTPLVENGRRYETMITVREPDAESFAIRQMVRADEAEPWRVIVDMTYRQR
ncbi:hypothetical protein [Sinisalibacter lacisalsi]|uniref:DUF1579 domain-containing protein n=1 Tax=Sinisalibacter lacisalsi TaxID=1526570 RepID=A0ABQ1QQC7_9RHOB|nr:hypothetical protein [Sinisalibacter lacisalsi]GGD39396.1 hypothetical protein GCM10011358_24160 [Sinisalibacter lacisalsi]